MDLRLVCLLLLPLLLPGGDCLKCKVGIGILSKEVDCSGDWEGLDGIKSQVMSLTKGGNLTDFTNLFSFASGRRRRQAETEATSEAAEADSATTEDPNAYYCLKHSLLGVNVRSCAPKSVLGIANSLCQEKTAGKTCACNTELCNTGSTLKTTTAVLILSTLVALPFL